MTTRRDLQGFTQGAYVERVLAWQDVNGGVIALTNRTFASQLRYRPGDPVAYNWVVVVDQTGGRVILQLTKAVSELVPAGLLWWDLWETTDPNKPDAILSGRIPVRRRVTHV